MAFRADNPNRQNWFLIIIADLKVTVVLVKGQKADFRALLDTFEGEIVAHLLVPIVHVCSTFTHEHCID